MLAALGLGPARWRRSFSLSLGLGLPRSAPLIGSGFKFGLLLHSGESSRNGLGLFRHRVADRPRHSSLGRDPLRLKWLPNANTYWIERRPPGPARASMK